ncbi:hypothetical protein L596_007017 [Steinernema carpocapsae]|uniref:Uncharacterized protein n=1 Tax=Steinernema carpocapsae TaxID=34508 RepID=A0A4U5P7W5_STECR|nr:hypothetical protein L596_007017 [Steinernema carpocapsae]
MLRSLSRRSSLFESQYLRLQTDPRDLRTTERFLRSCSYSDFSSIAPSVSWQNRLNCLRQSIFRLFRLPKSLILRLLLSFVVIWIIASAIIRPIERTSELERQNKEDNDVYALRLQFLQRFGRMDYYIPMSNTEWEESTRYLVGWYQKQLVNLTATVWTFPYAFAFSYFVGSGSAVPGTLQLRLSTYSKILLVLWFPMAISLHFYTLFTFANVFRRILKIWKNLLVIISFAGQNTVCPVRCSITFFAHCSQSSFC